MAMSLRAARARKLHTVRSLAAAAGLAPSTVHLIEAGTRTPRVDAIRKISVALGVEPSEIAEFAAAIEAHGKPRRSRSSCADRRTR